MIDQPRACVSPKELKPGQVGWGLYDCADKCWMGNDNGPMIYVDGVVNGQPFNGKEMAGAAATIIGRRMKWSWGRLRPVLYQVNADKVKDVVVPLLSVDEAMKDVERGHY